MRFIKYASLWLLGILTMSILLSIVDTLAINKGENKTPDWLCLIIYLVWALYCAISYHEKPNK